MATFQIEQVCDTANLKYGIQSKTAFIIRKKIKHFKNYKKIFFLFLYNACLLLIIKGVEKFSYQHFNLLQKCN